MSLERKDIAERTGTVEPVLPTPDSIGLFTIKFAAEYSSVEQRSP